MARSGRSSQKSGARRVTLGILLFGAFALIVAQSAPQISQFFVPARTTISDRIGAPADTSFWAQISGQSERERRIRELENEVRDLARYKAAAISMAERMEAYESILNLMGEPPERGVTARITTVVDGPFAQTVLANAGRLQGVAPGAIAMNEGGVVGRVTQLGDRSSRILLISNYQSQLPALGEVSGVRAVMQGKDRDRGVLVGATVMAPYGGEVIGMLVTAVHAGVPVATLRRMHFAYPTFHRGIEAALSRLSL